MISWGLLSAAIEYYSSRGYRYVEAPWVVPDEIHNLTCPNEWVIRSDVGALVGSAEQSFLAMDRSGNLAPGRWQACTPCFRTEVVADDLHQPYFMKVELYDNHSPSVEKVRPMLDHAFSFFNAYAPNRTTIV